MVWYNLKIEYLNQKLECKYTSLSIDEKEYPYCDSEGNILNKVSGKFDKGYFVNEQTGEKHDKAFKLINGKASKGFSGRIKEVKAIIVDSGESEDLLVEKEFVVENDDLYNNLKDKNQEIKFGAFFGNGYKAYKVYVIPSKLYKGFCIMKIGRGNKSEILKNIIQERNDIKDLKSKLDSINITLNKVNETKIEDLLEL
jgi:hypothetical protein